MSSNSKGVNPLRPYYIPPTIGEPSAQPANIPGPNAFSRGNSTGKYASKARDIFSDLDYTGYIADPSPSTVKTVKDLLDELIWKYTSIFLAQPFEVAKLLLQVRVQDDVGGLAAAASAAAAEAKAAASLSLSRQSSYRDSIYDLPESDSEGDEPAYFTSNVPSTPSPTYSRSKRRGGSVTDDPLESPRIPKKGPELLPHQLNIRRPDSITEAISQLWQKEGAWGVCKGTNVTFVYTVLQSLLENWSRSLLSALFDVPDLGLKGDLDRLVDIASPYPWASLGVAAAAAVLTGLILCPLDMVRTRSIITPAGRAPRRTLAMLRAMPSYLCPSSLILPTAFHSLVHPLLSLSTPLVLRTKFKIDGEASPTTFSLAKFCSSTAALFIKLPLETVLRRGQAAVLAQPEYVRAMEQAESKKGKEKPLSSMETVVPVGRYNGIVGTMYLIANEEGSRVVPTTLPARGKGASKRGKPKVAETVFRRGQGVEGLWRGWKVNWWGLVGLWTAAVVGGGGDGEF